MKKTILDTDISVTKFGKIEEFLKKSGEPDYRFGQLTKAILEQRVDDFEKITTLSKKLRESLTKQFGPILTIKPINKAESKQSVKVLFELEDGERVEAVKTTFIQEEKQWSSLCISSQVGCGLNCRFCATGKIGLKRNLTADEIIDQILYFYLEEDKINNISFSGMGEPLLNPAIFTALSILANKNIFNISPRRINLSTVGIVPGLERLAKDFPQVNIAFSIHSPFQKQREELMPIAKQYSLDSIFEVLDQHLRKNRRKIFLPYLMLKEINDTPEHCQALKQLILKRKNPYLYHVNLVQYHPSSLLGKTFQPSNRGTVDWFKNTLEKSRIEVTVRQSFGESIDAACGQLYARYQKANS